MELSMDLLAEKAGIDPFEFRYRNVYREGDTSNTSEVFDVHPMAGIMERIKPTYEALKARAKAASTPE